jgi:hypothetical protein
LLIVRGFGAYGTAEGLSALIEEDEASRKRAEWRTATITRRHVDLRERAKQTQISRPEVSDRDRLRSGRDDASVAKEFVSLADAWREAVDLSTADAKDARALLSYAEAAEETGRKPWVTEALRWCHEVVVRFVTKGGALELAMRRERRAFFARAGRTMTSHESSAVRRKLERACLGADGEPGLVPETNLVFSSCAEGVPPRGHDRRVPTLLDVGSCWDYFRTYEPEFYHVVALDLCPRSPSVFACDFLELEVSAEGTALGTEVKPPDDRGTNRKALLSYPKNAASAVVMSLVLSYVPDPQLRGEMVRKAREILLDDGRGVLLITTPHSTDRAYSQKNRTDALARWRTAIESVGFERIEYRRKKSVHCVAFRTVGSGPGPVSPGDAPELPIAFDTQERRTPATRA